MQKNNMSFLKNLTTVADARTARASSWDQSGRNKDYWLVNAGDTAVMADVEGPGCINHIWVTTFCREILGPSIQHPVLSGSVAPVTEMENAEGVNWEINDPDYYRKVLIRMTWDDFDGPSVLAPLGDFFCIGHSMPSSFSSIPFNVSSRPCEELTFGGTASMNCYFPMPFNKRAKIEVIKSAITPDFLVAIGNSFLIAVAVTIIALILHSMCGYAFARMNFPGKKPMFTVIISTLMIPVSSILVPLFMICKQLGITNSYAGILLPALFNAYGIFLFRQFYMSFPADLEEAAKLDGCSTYRMFFTIIFPLSRPIIIPLSIAFFLGNWNNYLWPLIVNKKPEYRTVMVYLANMVGGYNTKWNVVIASAMLACLPVFLISLLLQSHLQNSIKMSGIK